VDLDLIRIFSFSIYTCTLHMVSIIRKSFCIEKIELRAVTFFAVLGLQLMAYTTSNYTSPFFVKGFLR
jgi:hypothetical protein